MTALRGIKTSGERADFMPSSHSALAFSVFIVDHCHFFLARGVSGIKRAALTLVSEVASTGTVGLSAYEFYRPICYELER